MPSETDDLANFLASSIPDEVKKHTREFIDLSRDFAERFERSFNAVPSLIREHLQGAPFISDYLPPPPPAPRRLPAVPLGYVERLQSWISRNRAITAALLAFFGTGTFILWRRRRLFRQRRRAKRAWNGSKQEVVVLAGSPHSLLTRSLAVDLNRRGFIVYIPVSSPDEVDIIKAELGADFYPLDLDITSPESIRNALDKFKSTLANPRAHGIHNPHALHFASLILLGSYPSTHYTGPISTLTPALWSDTLNAHLLYPFAVVQAFLPLLNPQPTPSITQQLPTSLLLLTPSIIPSLVPPNHAPESLSVAAFSTYVKTLRAELPTSTPLKLTHLKLGAFDLKKVPTSRTQLATVRAARYGNATPSQLPTGQSPKSVVELNEVRELHNAVFDAVVGRTPGTVWVGRGAWTYDMAGQYIPAGIIGWLWERKQNRGEGRQLGAAGFKSTAVKRGFGLGLASDAGSGESGTEGSVEWEAVEKNREGV